jgi:hypothetical protein
MGADVSQPPALEKGARPLRDELRSRLTLIPGPRRDQSTDDRFLAQLSALGYPGFAHVESARSVPEPGVVLVDALSQPTLDARVTEALPWVARHYAGELDWMLLVRQAKLHNLQNRMGFLIQLAVPSSPEMQRALDELDEARLLAEATFRWDSMQPATRKWMRENRSSEAAHWNVVTRIRPEDLLQ